MSESKPATSVVAPRPAPSIDRTAALVEELCRLLDEHPHAVVGAIQHNGLFTAMPASIPIVDHPVAGARSALDLVQVADRGAIIEAWRTVRDEGRSQVPVALASTPPAPATCHFFDLTAEHGVFVGVFVGTHATEFQLHHVAEIPPPPPRVARTRKDSMATVISVDPAITGILGWAPEELIGRSSLEFIHPDDQQRTIDLWMECLARPGTTVRARMRHRHRDGSYVWLELANTSWVDDDGTAYVDGEVVNISEEMEAHEAVRSSERLLRRLAASLPVGVAQFDTRRNIVYANERLYEIVGAEPGADGQSLLAAVPDLTTIQQATLAVDGGGDVDMQIVVVRLDDGARRDCTLTMRALTNDDDEVIGGVLVLNDVTDEARLRAELERRAANDDLTGCANRRTVITRLAEALALCGDNGGHGTAAIFVDLDDFKRVNDVHGHAAGDAVLVTVASRLQTVVRGNDVVGRIGGDEFLIVCPSVTDRDDAFALALRVSMAMEEPLTVGESSLRQTASIGVAWADAGVRVDASTLIADADQAMYAAKRDGTSNIVLGLDLRP